MDTAKATKAATQTAPTATQATKTAAKAAKAATQAASQASAAPAPKRLVIIPTYNEIENIEAICRAVFALEEGYHILVIDDGSPDGTAVQVQKLQNEFPDRLFLICRSGKLGLGTAYITGFKWALEQGYDYITEMDADFSHDPKDLPRLSECCEKEGADVAIGSRYADGVSVVNWPAKKKGFCVKEVPVIFVNRKAGISKMSGSIFGEAFWGVIGLRFRKF